MSNRSVGGASRLKSAMQIIVGSHFVAAGLATYYGNEKWYKHIIMPFVHLTMDGETAHRVAVWTAKWGIVPRIKQIERTELKTKLFDIEFSNPVGLAAGFDKDAEAVNGLFRIGFGFVEVGSVTPLPQAGNPKPRVFRLSTDRAIINRYGFNSAGHDQVFENIKSIKNKEKGILAINLGKNKESVDAAQDYIRGIKLFSPVADILVINISSPNTPGLRTLQGQKNLENLLLKVRDCIDKLPSDSKKPPIFLKIAPDLTMQDKIDISQVLSEKWSPISGMIVSNTTLTRSADLQSSAKTESGGLSGAPLKHLSTQTIKDMYKLTNGKIPIIGVGGIETGVDAYQKLRAGATLVQIYSVLAYEGPPIATKINRELADIIKKEGFNNVSEIIGLDVKS